MSSITPHYRTITELLQSRSFSIDEYQREYKWERNNIEELLSDLLGKFYTSYLDGDTPDKTAGYADYFLGSIIVTKRDNHLYLVDGQQRVTSLTLLLIYLYRVSKERELRVASTLEPLIFSDNLGKVNFNLAVPERIPAIHALFHGEEYNTDGKEESLRTIVDRYRDVEEIDLAQTLGDGFATFVYWLLTKVGLIEIEAASDTHAYSIFETMNDRGKPLSPVDMLKAYLLAPIESREERAAANRVWKQTVLDLITWGPDPNPERDAIFVKAWLRAQYADTIRDRKAGAIDKDWELIGSGFHRWLRDNEQRVGAAGAERHVQIMTEEVPFFARAYRAILDAGHHYTPGLESIFFNDAIAFTWQYTVLLAPLTITDDEETVRRKLAAVATYLDIWVMRRAVNHMSVDYSTVNYNMWTVCRDIRRASLGDLVQILVDKLNTDDVTFSGGGPRKRGGIENMQLNQASRRYIRHLLARVTAYVEVGAGRADQYPTYMDRSTKNGFDIEHLWADKYERYAEQFESEQDFNAWRNDVAALVLLPADVNRSYQDKPFELKVPHYVKQNFYAASLTEATYEHQPQFAKFITAEQLPFRSYDRFGKGEQQERSALLLALAGRIWSTDRLDVLRP